MMAQCMAGRYEIAPLLDAAADKIVGKLRGLLKQQGVLV